MAYLFEADLHHLNFPCSPFLKAEHCHAGMLPKAPTGHKLFRHSPRGHTAAEKTGPRSFLSPGQLPLPGQAPRQPDNLPPSTPEFNESNDY